MIPFLMAVNRVLFCSITGVVSGIKEIFLRPNLTKAEAHLEMKLKLLCFLLSGFNMVIGYPDDDPVLRAELIPQSELSLALPASSADDTDPLADLVSSSPEVLHRDAQRLQEAAKRDLSFAKKVLHESALVDRTQPGRLLLLAAHAIEDPALLENTVLVRKWASWWFNAHKPVPYDTRLNAERFLTYVVDRLFDRSNPTSEEMHFDKELDHEYVSVKKKESAALPFFSEASESLEPTHTLNVSIYTDTCPLKGKKSDDTADSEGVAGPAECDETVDDVLSWINRFLLNVYLGNVTS